MLNKKILFTCLLIFFVLTVSNVSASEIDNETSNINSVIDCEINKLSNYECQVSESDEELNSENVNYLVEDLNKDVLASYEANWEDMQSNVSVMNLDYQDAYGNVVSSSNYVSVYQYGDNNQFIDVKMKKAFTGTIDVNYDEYNYLTKKSLLYSDIGFEHYFYDDEDIQTFTYDLSDWEPGHVYMTVKNEDTNPIAYINFYITKGIIAPDVVKIYGGNEKFIVKVFDDKNKPINGETVEIFLNGLKYITRTDSSGIASIDLNLRPGVYDVVTVQYKNTIKSKVKIIPSTKLTVDNIESSYNEVKDWTITLKDCEGNLLSGKTVTILLNGITYNRNTDDNGQATLTIPASLDPNNYTATFSFAGNKDYAKSSTKATLTVSKITSELNAVAKNFNINDKTKKYTVTLKDSEGVPVQSTKVTLKVNGKTYTANTNVNGVATFKMTKLAKKGNYKATIKFAGDKYYKSASKTVQITVKKPETSKSVTLNVIYSNTKFPKKKLSNGDVIMTNYEKKSGRQWSPGVYATASHGVGLVEAKYTKLVKCTVWFKNSKGKVITKTSTKFQYNWYIKVGLKSGYTPYKAKIWYKTK